MRSAILGALSAVCSVLAAACASDLQRQEMQKALSLTPEHFRQTTKVKDDEFETVVTFTTEDGYKEKRGLLGIVWSDEFLRAFLDKKTGAVRFQVYVAWVHQSRDWMHPFQANFGKPLMTVPTLKINSDVSCSGGKHSACLYSEHIAFDWRNRSFGALSTVLRRAI